MAGSSWNDWAGSARQYRATGVSAQIGRTREPKPIQPRMMVVKSGQRLAPGEKGLVIAPRFSIRADGALTHQVGIDPQELRTALMLWDCIDYPGNDLVNPGTTEEMEFLVDEGLLRKTQVNFGGPLTDLSPLLTVAREAAEFLDAVEPGHWSIGRLENEESVFTGDGLPDGGLLVRLHNAIPVPAHDVPLEDLLAFKQKREAELKALQHYLDNLYQKILAAPDRARAEDTELAALDRALADHMKAIRETGFKKVLGNLSASLDLTKAAEVAGIGAAAYTMGLPMAGAVAGAATILNVSLGIGRNRAASDKPFEYVTRLHRDLRPWR